MRLGFLEDPMYATQYRGKKGQTSQRRTMSGATQNIYREPGLVQNNPEHAQRTRANSVR